jgi:hypothetical protein
MSEVSLCALCRLRPGIGRGEHVWPQWYLGDSDRLGPPASGWATNDVPITNRDGVQIHPAKRQRVLLPACTTCNGEMDRRFEKPAMPVIRRLKAAGWSGPATADEWGNVGRWFAKILLLLGNPQARYEHPAISDEVVRFGLGTPDISWLTNGEPPPEGLSLWVFRASAEPAAPTYRMSVPRLVRVPDGDPVTFHFLQVSMDGLSVTLLSHPGWTVQHPLVERGHAWELLRDPPEGGDLTLLPKLSRTVVQWRASDWTLTPGARLGQGLPPLYATDAFMAPELAGVVAEFG